MQKEILSILAQGKNFSREIDYKEAINSALNGDLTQKSLPKISYISSHFRLSDNDKPLAHTNIQWLSSDDRSISNSGSLRTNENGWGMLNLENNVFQNLSSLNLLVTIGKETVKFENIQCADIRKKLDISGPNNLKIEFTNPADTFIDAGPIKKKSKRFSLAVSGKPEQLEKIVPMLKDRACIRLRSIFVESKTVKKINVPDKNIKIAPLDKNSLLDLSGIDLLIDLNNNPMITKFAKAQVLGKAKIKTIIIPDIARFIGKEEKLLMYYEQPEEESVMLKELLRHIAE